MEKISGTERARNEILHRTKQERNKLHTINRRKNHWIRHILRRNCLLKQVAAEKVEETGRRGTRCKQLLDKIKNLEYTEN